MGSPEINKLPYLSDLVSWLGIGWIIAFLAGLWGAMIGVGRFGASEFLFLMCGAIVLGKVAYETMRERTTNRFVAFTVCLLLVVSTEYYVLHWTNNLAIEAGEQQKRLAQLDQIPTLNHELNAMRNDNSIAQARAQQQVSDIGQTNDDLKASIEKKDAQLATIAEKQYALNFLPQVYVVSNSTPDKLTIMNNGNYEVTVINFIVNGRPLRIGEMPAIMTKSAALVMTLSDDEKNRILSEALGGNAERLPIEGTANLKTKDGKNYVLGFTWLFNIKDGSIVKTDVIDRPIVETAQP